jgi:DNA modification methylase
MAVSIITGDCREVLRTLEPESVHMVCTSPPYWGLRNYQVPPSIWGGDEDCEHEWLAEITLRKGSTNGRSDLGSTPVSVDAEKTLAPGRQNDHGETKQYRSDASGFCSHCGAWRGAHGLEPDYHLFVENEVRIFREVWRVLRADGTLWLNLGDSYANDGKWGGHTGGKHVKVLHCSCIKAGCPIGGTVLDCFAGAGTTGLVADRLQRNAVLIELNPEYAAMARARIDGDAPLFAGAAE